ncbi:MAG: hypothetical protein HZB87_11575 [Desulfatitalea sp.]|nr:hypothetical protein [Desulfatitalea sp.]MBI5896628.1 hypothetical protein [Desulfobacterales bacterium]
MNEIIKKNLVTLAILQRTDTARETIERYLAGVGERIDSLSRRLTTVEQQVNESQLQLDTLKKQYRSDENETKSIEAGIAKSDGKLGSVKTNKEYQSILKEIDDLKLKNGTLEDRMLELLEQIEAAEKQVKVLKADRTDLAREIDEQQNLIRKEAETQSQELASLNRERDEIWAEFNPKMQKMYSRAKQQGKGIAVAAVIDGICQVCRMNIPPQTFIELLRLDSMSMCPNCQRIIYPKAVIEGA